MMKIKKYIYILLIFVAFINMQGCGKTDGERSGKTRSSLPLWIKECCFENAFVENTGVQEMMETCKKMDIPSEDMDSQYRPQIDDSVLRDLLACVEKEKRRPILLLV